MEETKVKSFNFQKILPIIVIQLVIAFVYFGAVVLPWYDHKGNHRYSTHLSNLFQIPNILYRLI